MKSISIDYSNSHDEDWFSLMVDGLPVFELAPGCHKPGWAGPIHVDELRGAGLKHTHPSPTDYCRMLVALE